MSAVELIIERLLQAGTPFTGVFGAADFAAIEDDRPVSPAAYVLTLDEASGPNERVTGPVLQRLESDIAVVIVVDNVADYRMGAASSDLQPLKSFVRSRLIGFEPDGIEGPVTHVSGKTVRATSGSVWFEDVYSAATYLIEDAS